MIIFLLINVPTAQVYFSARELVSRYHCKLKTDEIFACPIRYTIMLIIIQGHMFVFYIAYKGKNVFQISFLNYHV